MILPLDVKVSLCNAILEPFEAISDSKIFKNLSKSVFAIELIINLLSLNENSFE